MFVALEIIVVETNFLKNTEVMLPVKYIVLVETIQSQKTPV